MSSSQPTDRLDQIQQELASILEERLGALSAALQQNEATTRRIVAAEMEMQRHSRDHARMASELTRLESEAAEFASRREEMETRHAGVLADRDAKRTELERMEEVVRTADAANAKDRRRLAELEDEASALRQENADLKTKLRTIEENIARMKALRDEIMNSISGQTHHMKRLAGAGTD